MNDSCRNGGEVMKEFLKNKKGDAIVEATMLLPFCLVMIIAMYFAAIYVCQKANLQANLQNTLIYYKNTYSDTFIGVADEPSYSQSDGKDIAGSVNKYDASKYKNPYRFFTMDKPGSGFEKLFITMAGHMFFEAPGGDNIEVDVKTTNYVVYQALSVDVSQTITPAINLNMIGVDNKMDIDVSGTVVVSDGDDFIRNTDLVIDVIQNTEIGKAAKDLVDDAVEVYEKFKDVFGI